MSFLRSVFTDQVIQFGKNFGISGKGSFYDKEKIVDRGTLWFEAKTKVLRFNMILILFPLRVSWPSYLFPGKFGRSGKGSFSEKAKIVDRGSQWRALESTYFKLEYDPYLIL